MRSESRRQRGLRRARAVCGGRWLASRPIALGLLLAGVLALAGGPVASAEGRVALGAHATLAEIEACAARNLPADAGRIEFSVDAIDRSGSVTTSRAEMRWRQDEADLAQVILRVSEPARTAGTALLIIDRESAQPEFFVRLPDLPKAKRVRSRRLRGPVLGTDFSFEDLQRLGEPLDRTALELVGLAAVAGRPAWLLEAVPDAAIDSEYTRVLTYVDQATCMPIQIELFEAGDKLRKRLHAPIEELRPVAGRATRKDFPHVFVMEDLRRDTRTVVRVEEFEARSDWPAEQFTKRGLEMPIVPARSAFPDATEGAPESPQAPTPPR